MKLGKLNWILISSFFVVNVFGDIPFASAQENEDEREKKMEITKTVTNEGESIHLRIEKKDGSVYENTYANEDEMKNDPELKDMDLHFNHDEQFLMRTSEGQDGMFEVTVISDDGEESNRVFMFKSEDGALHEFQDGDIQWIEESEDGDDNMNFFLKNDGGDTYKIIRDEDGEIQIEKNGVLMDIEELEKDGNTKVDIGEDGTVTISESDDNEQNIMIFKSEDGDNITMKLSEGFIWEGDSLNNEFLMGDPDGQIDWSEDGNRIIRLKVESEDDGDGKEKFIIHKTVNNVKIEILDINNFKEISDVPGVLLNEGKDLSLEEVNYYPNPSTGQFNLRFKGKRKPIEVKILDLKGRVIYKESITNFDGMYDSLIDLSGNEPGLYVLQVIQNDKSWTKKIMIE